MHFLLICYIWLPLLWTIRFNFRLVLDPVYARLNRTGGVSENHLSDISDDDLRRAELVGGDRWRYSEDRPLIRSTLRASNPPCLMHPPPQFGGQFRYGGGVQNGGSSGSSSLETPITIALTPGGDQYVSLNLDRRRGVNTVGRTGGGGVRRNVSNNQSSSGKIMN